MERSSNKRRFDLIDANGSTENGSGGMITLLQC